MIVQRFDGVVAVLTNLEVLALYYVVRNTNENEFPEFDYPFFDQLYSHVEEFVVNLVDRSTDHELRSSR